MSMEAAYTNRRTRDILEDYDLALFATSTNGTTDYPGPVNDPQSLWLGLDYFGYTENPGSNFVIATLNGGKRNYQGLDLIFRKRYSDNWQLLGSYSYNWAKGNTNSDSNADFQGDVLYLDPLAPDTYKKQPGTIPHVFKAAGLYIWPIGFELGAPFRYNSGTIASQTALASQRNLPIQVPVALHVAGVTRQLGHRRRHRLAAEPGVGATGSARAVQAPHRRTWAPSSSSTSSTSWTIRTRSAIRISSPDRAGRRSGSRFASSIRAASSWERG